MYLKVCNRIIPELSVKYVKQFLLNDLMKYAIQIYEEESNL